MLKKSQRLGKKEIENFFKSRFKIYKSGELLLRVKQNDKAILRFAFMVSSSIKKNAVARNLTRRRMAEIARETSLKNSTNGLDLLFSFKLSDKKAPSFSILKNDMINLLSICGVLSR